MTGFRMGGGGGGAGLPALRNYANLQYQQPSGTNGGSNVNAAWTNVPLNTKVIDPQAIISAFAANVFTLVAGTFYLRGTQATLSTGDGKLRIRNTTSAATLIVGTNCQGNSGSNNGVDLSGLITVIAGQVLALQYYTLLTQANTGLGNAMTTGEVEVYANLDIWQVA